jgi:hypothetical protein
MRLSHAFLAKFADTNPEGTFTVVGGGLALLPVAATPVTLPTLATVLRVLVPPDECGREHQLTVHVTGPGGQEPFREIVSTFTPAQNPYQPHREVAVDFVFQAADVVLPEPGDYQFQFAVDDTQLGAVTLAVVRAAPHSTQPAVECEQKTRDREEALRVRRQWMQQMGFSEEEIAEACCDEGPVSLEEEQDHLRAAEKLAAATPPAAELRKWAIKY